MCWRVISLTLLTSVLALTAADEAADPEGLLEPIAEPIQNDSEYYVYVGRWTECTDYDQRRNRSDTKPSLVHTPRLGLQRRELQCRTKRGQVVEAMYCGGMGHVGSIRVCIVRQDCVVGDWSEWRPRSDGALVRTRQLRLLPQGGGKPCGLIEEVKPVAPDPSAHWAPGPWGKCKVATDTSTGSDTPTQDDIESDDLDIFDDEVTVSDGEDMANDLESCGGGVQRRDASCVNGDGTVLHPSQCAYTPLPTLVQPCEEPCPRDCEVGEWSDWSACQPSDGCPLFPVQELTSTGYSVRRRRVTTAASGGGAACPPLEEKRSCASPRCASWQALPWGPCVLLQHHKVCGRGKRMRELRCVGHDGKEAQPAWCSGSSAPTRMERCRIACAGDCVVSAWEPWSPCSAPCATVGASPPLKKRQRHILAHPSPTGWACPPQDQLVQHDLCNTHACASYSWLATPWGPCETNRPEEDFSTSNYTDFLDDDMIAESNEDEPCVEEGEMTRDVMCVQNNADVVRDSLCLPLRRPSSRRACTVRCHRGCRVKAWGPWSPCPNTCEIARQTRVRSVQGGAGCGPRQQSRACETPRSCRAPSAIWRYAEWSTCRLRPGHLCGQGYRTRSIWCALDGVRVESGACAGRAVPLSVASCGVSCTRVPQLACSDVCADPLMYMDSTNPDIPNCVCKNVSLELLPSISDCILPARTDCGSGHLLRQARCRVNSKDVPMAVCRKYHPLTDRSDQFSTSYSYSEEFPDLVQGACAVRCARDCMAGPWGEWGPCAAEAGSLAAFRFRTREVLEEGTAGGRECGATLQRSTCAVSEPRWLASDWSACAPKHGICGHTLINRTITCVDAKGAPLEDSACERAGPAPPREATCRAPCPADCFVSAWSEWSPCEQTKWGGRRDRTRVVLRPAAGGGAACPRLVEAATCAPHAYSWHVAPWDDCQPLGGSPCGEGIKRRAVRCLRSDGVFVNDSFCPNATGLEARESWCYVPCGVDCELGEWGPWDRSACACGDLSNTKHMHRIRQSLTSAVWPGRACAEVEQKAPCPYGPCMKLVSRERIKCSVQATRSALYMPEACGWGAKILMNRCEITNPDDDKVTLTLDSTRCPASMPGHIITSPQSYEEEACEVECGCQENGEAAASPWGQWGPCHHGTRIRTRKLRHPVNTMCRSSPKHVSIEWMNCTEGDEIPNLLEIETRNEEKPRRAWLDHEVYHDGYTEGSSSVLAVVWTATLVLSFYGAFMVYRGLVKCLRSRRLKSVTKV